MIKSGKLFIFVFMIVITLCNVSLLQARSKNPYSYLSKPPLTINAIITPDKAVYEEGEIIDIAILIKLDPLRYDTLSEYRVYIGNLDVLLKNSELVDSEVYDYYPLSIKRKADVISFKVKMLRRFSPPYLAIKAMRVASPDSDVKKQFMDIKIDQYSETYITSPEYAKERRSGYISPGY